MISHFALAGRSDFVGSLTESSEGSHPAEEERETIEEEWGLISQMSVEGVTGCNHLCHAVLELARRSWPLEICFYKTQGRKAFCI